MTANPTTDSSTKISAAASAGNRLKISVNLMPNGPISDVIELAKLAEELGFSRCWVYDEGTVTRDVYVTLAAIATATHAIRLGPGITNPYVRHPGATAAAIASLDELSSGRAFLGLGAGGGLTLNPLALQRRQPVTTVAEMVSTLRQLWAGETVSHQGSVFSFDQARLDYGRTDIEILLAGRGPRMLELGGLAADGFYLSYLHKSLLGSAVAGLRAAKPDRRGPFTIVYSTMVATTDAEVEAARAQLSFRLVDSPPEVKDLLSMSDGDVAAIRRALAEGGPSAAATFVKPEWVSEFVIVGDAEAASAELRELLVGNDIDEFQIPVSDLGRGAAFMESMAALLTS